MEAADWAKLVLGIIGVLQAGQLAVIGLLWKRSDAHEASDDRRFREVLESIELVRQTSVPRQDLQALVYAGILSAVKDINADFRGEVGRQMGLLAGRLDDLIGQIGRVRHAQNATQQDLIVVATKLDIDLPARPYRAPDN